MRLIGTLLVSGLLMAVGGCRPDGQTTSAAPRELRILGGSELLDMAPVFERVKRELGIEVVFTPIGSVEGAQVINRPEDRKDYDAVWFASDQFFGLWPGSRKALAQQSPPLMRSPIILGLHTEAAQRTGLARPEDASWARILDVIDQGQLRYGMTSPDLSNSGMATLTAAATALADTGAPISLAEMPDLLPKLRRFFVANRLRAESSRYLADRYLEQSLGRPECRRGIPSAGVTDIDGLFTYESEVLRLISKMPAEDCLVPVYPTEGTIIADYRLDLLRGTSPEAAAAYEQLWRFLYYNEDVQLEIAETTRRRPGNPHVAGGQEQATVAQLRYPADPTVLRRLVDLYREQIRPPSRMVFVLDTSGSMRGQKLAQLKQVFVRLTGADPKDPTTYFSFLPDEQVVLIPFGTRPGKPARFALPADDTASTLAELRAYAQAKVSASGWTAMYDSLVVAHEITVRWLQEPPPDDEPPWPVSIVVLSDGQNTCGSRNFTAYQRFRQQLPEAARQVPVHTIVFGRDQPSGGVCAGYQPDSGPSPDPAHRPCEGSAPSVEEEGQWERELRVIAEQSGGLCSAARTGAELYARFWRIRGYR